MRLKVAAKVVKYYNSIDRPLTANIMAWDKCLKNFKMEWESLQEMKKGKRRLVPANNLEDVADRQMF